MADTPTPKVPMVNVKTGEALRIPADKADAARQAGFTDYAAGSATDAATAGAGQGLTLGYSDELKGALAAIQDALHTGKIDRAQAARAYTQARDDYRRKLAQLETAHPDAYGAGRVAGGIASGVAASAIPGMQGVGGAALLGAADALGNNAADLTTKEGLKDTAGDVAKGAAIGGGFGAVGKGIAKTFSPTTLRTAAETAYLAQHELTPAKLGEANQAQARATAGRALDELTPGVFDTPHTPEARHLAAKAARTDSASKLDALYGAFDTHHGPTIEPRQLSQRIQSAAADAVKSKPELLPAVQKAVRAIDPDAFDAAEKAWNLRQTALIQQASAAHAAYPQQLANAQRIRAQAQTPAALANAPQIPPKPPPIPTAQPFPWQRWAPKGKMTLAQAQEAINRMRDIGAAPEGKPALLSKAEMDADKDVFTPAWHTSADTLRDTITQHAPQDAAAINGERARYGQLRGLEKAAAAQERNGVPTSIGDKIKSATAVPAAVGGTALASGHAPSALPAAVASGVAQHLLTPRAPQILNNAAKVTAHPATRAAGTAVQQLTNSFGRFFQNVSPERRAVIEHKLLQVSPSYAALRAKAAKELDRDAPAGSEGAAGEADPHGAQNVQVNVAK